MTLRDEILNKGYTILPSLFSAEEVSLFKEASKLYDYGDLLSYPSLASFVLNAKLLESIRKIIDAKPVYFGDSGLLIGPRPRGLHRDLKTEKALSMDGLILRVGLYISPQGKESGGLKIVQNSQFQKNPFFKILFSSKNIELQLGDVIVWDLRLLHSGSALMPFGFNISLPPLIENLLDRSGPKRNVDRLVLLTTFSDNSDLMKLYCQERDSEHMKEHWQKSFNWNEEVTALINASDLEIVRRN
jgi:hypothetical protein